MQDTPEMNKTPDTFSWGVAAGEGNMLGMAASSPRFSLAELADAGKALATATPWTEQRADSLHTEGASSAISSLKLCMPFLASV
jgi:hypothetical protein